MDTFLPHSVVCKAILLARPENTGISAPIFAIYHCAKSVMRREHGK